MNFSELRSISVQTGLDWDGQRLALYGSLCDYPVYIVDIPEKREYLLTVFCRTGKNVDKAATDGITALLEKLPPNCVTERKNQLKYQQIRFNARFLYQENLALLSELISELPKLLDRLDIPPEPSEEHTAFPAAEKPPQKLKKPANEVSERFDKYSLRGFIGAFIGAAAMSVITGMLINIEEGNIGSQLASWVAGGLIALVVLADYRLLAKKMDVFGTLSCSLLTLLSCVFGVIFNTVRQMLEAARSLDPSVSLSQMLESWGMYQVLFPEVWDNFTLLLIKNLFIAVLASAAFYIFYYRRHPNIMY